MSTSSLVIIAIIVMKTSILVLGGAITYFASKAYFRTQNRSLRALSIGFGVVTLGALLAGIADQLLNTAVITGILINSFLTAIGFAIIAYSLSIE